MITDAFRFGRYSGDPLQRDMIAMGEIAVYKVPWQTKEDTIDLWYPREVDPKTHEIRVPARMSEDERRRYLEPIGRWGKTHVKNLLVNNGKAIALKYLGYTGALPANSEFAAILSLGTGSLTAVLATDTSVTTELYRQAWDANGVVAGASVTLTCTITGSNGNGTLTNIGIYGEGATTGLGVGTLHNKALLAYPKATGTVVFVWVITLNT